MASTISEISIYGPIYAPNAMADKATGAEKPMVNETHPDKYPSSGLKALVIKWYSPPDLFQCVPSSA